MSDWLNRIEQLVLEGQSSNEKTLVIIAGKPAFFSSDGNDKNIANFIMSNQDLVGIIRDIAPEIIPMVQRGENIPGELPLQSVDNIAYHVVYREKNIKLTIFIDRKEFELTPTSATTSSFTVDAVQAKESVVTKLPPELMEHRSNLYLIASKDPNLSKYAFAHAQEKKLYPHIVKNSDELKTITDRFIPKIIVFDQSATDYSMVFKILYDITRNQRREIFIALVSSQSPSNDPVYAFSNSVNLMIHPNDISKFSKLMNDGMRVTEEFYLPLKRTIDKFKKSV